MELGFQTKNRLSDFIAGFFIGAIIIGGGFLFLLFHEEIVVQKLAYDVRSIIISVVFFLLVAVVEEVIIRGYVLRNLMISFNKYIALIISSVIFSLSHGYNPNVNSFGMFSIFLSGLLLGATYIYTKNLWFPIALHFSMNLFQTLLGFNVSGWDFYSLVEYSIPMNNILNGGAFGFEGSILACIAEISFLLGILYYFEKGNPIPKTK